MEQSRFFKFIWRANGILIFSTALLLLGLLLFVTFETLIPTFQDTPPPAAVATEGKDEPSDIEMKLRFESSQFAEKYVFVNLYAEYDQKGLKSYTRNETRNVGIHNLKNNKTNWLFPNNNQHVDQKSRIIKTLIDATDEETSVTTGHFLVTSTTSRDGKLIKDIWVSSVDGSEVQKLLSDVSGDPRLQIFGANQARILLKMDGALKAIEFDIETRTIGQSSIIKAPK